MADELELDAVRSSHRENAGQATGSLTQDTRKEYHASTTDLDSIHVTPPNAPSVSELDEPVRDNTGNKDDEKSPQSSSQAVNSNDEKNPPPSSQAVLPTGEPPSEVPAVEDTPPPYSVYTLWEKRLIVLAASIGAIFSPLTAQIYLPALTVLAQDFHVSDSEINLSVTTYMIFQGITPMFIGGFADTAGRRPAYVICFVIYIAANIGLALCKNYASLLVVRCLQSAGSSTTVALCQAVVADIVTSADRGQFIGITVLPIVIAPSLGPVLGGVLSQVLGWRWIFWFLAILAAVTLGAMLLFFPETCRKIVGDGSIRPHPVYQTFWGLIQDRQRKHRRQKKEADAAATGGLQRAPSTVSSRPPKTEKFQFKTPNLLGSLVLLFQKELGILLAYSSIVFAGFYAIATAMPSQFSQLYGFNEIQVGLMYLPMAGGSIVAAFIVGPTINRNYARHSAKMGLGKKVDKTRQMDLAKFPIEKARLEIGLPLLFLSAAVMVSWGWALQYGAPVAVPCVLLFLMGVGMIGFINAVNVLIVDICPGQAGAAVAANNLTRCLVGALASAVVLPMIDALGAGWAFTIFGVLYLVGAPTMWLVMARGMKWRAQVTKKDEEKARKKKERQDAKSAGVLADSTKGSVSEGRGL
ncbi:major facilitator superfamily domain-containing protein [Podospora didyma]|uniref:Major facilitator superfamily domain-containing protein n=1 Tax=Podospora didyma TaxID=330526 RepID=A0AAE0NYG3_9PEZI|nr:major facilitator superfamily domain-containing protein [Podospora didyma]